MQIRSLEGHILYYLCKNAKETDFHQRESAKTAFLLGSESTKSNSYNEAVPSLPPSSVLRHTSWICIISHHIFVTHLLFEPGPYDRDSIARASSQLGSSWFDSIISSTSSFTKFRFLSLKKDVAKPRLPMRPVRPMRCTYSSTSDGRSKLMTCLTLGMSRPRAATYIWWDMLANFSEVAGFSLISKGRYLCQILTAVATSMGLLPHLNRLKASSLSFCVRSPWIEVTGKPSR